MNISLELTEKEARLIRIALDDRGDRLEEKTNFDKAEEYYILSNKIGEEIRKVKEKDKEWNYDIGSVPHDTPVELLSSDDCLLLPQRKYVGTVIRCKREDGTFDALGECIEGDPDYFFRSQMIAWRPIQEEKGR